MNIRTLARGVTVFVALAVALTVMAVPASAAKPGVGTASIAAAERTVVAGTSNAQFTFTVTNALTVGQGAASAPSPNVNAVLIDVPQAFHTAVSAVSAPQGWTSYINNVGDFVFKTDGDGFLAGTGGTFKVEAAVGRPVTDLARRWRVYLSADKGGTNTEATPTTPGALDSTIRVLQVLSTFLSAPAGVTDGSATSGQTVSAAVEVLNAGGGLLSVTPEIRTSRPSGSNSTATATVSCPGAQNIASLATHTFICQVTFGGAGAITLTGDASGVPADGSGGSANGLDKSLAATVMTAANFVYNSTSLQPTEASPGQPTTFRLTVNKTGQVLVNLTKANTTLTFGPDGGPTFTASLAEPASVPRGTVNNLLLEFQSSTVPVDMPAGVDDPNGSPGFRSYDPTLTIAGADENDFAVSQKPDVTDLINVDALGPIIDIVTTPQPSKVEGRDAAASNGQTVNFSGTIKDRGTLCVTCTIESAVIKQYDASQAHIAGADIPVMIANSGGNLSGSFNGSYHADAFYMNLEVVGTDGANDTTQPSNIVDVDNILPKLAGALTGGENPDGSRVNDRSTIDVFIDERVASAAMAPTDWQVDGHSVLAAQPRAPQTLRGFDTVRLTLEPPLGRNEETVVTYAPSVPTRAEDRVGLDLLNASVAAVDGILPALPEVLSIGEGPTSEKQDGQYFTNSATPAIKIKVDEGDTVTTYEDCVENPATAADDCAEGSVEGELDDFDAPKCVAGADPGQSTVTCTPSLGTTERDVTLFFRSVDTRGNVGEESEELLTLDFTAPVLKAAQRVLQDIAVEVSEPLTELRGRDHTFDWNVEGAIGGFSESYYPQEVSGSGTSKTLAGNGSWDAPVAITQIRYGVDANLIGFDRYSDRAGNDLATQALAVSL